MHADLTSSKLTVLVRRMFRPINQEQPLLNLLALIREKEFFLSIKTFKRNTSQRYRNCQENGNFEGGKGKHQFRSMWTADGKILYKDENDNKVKICYD